MACPKPVGITNGEFVSRTTYTHGTRLYYFCNSGFTMTGAPSQLCSNGRWSGRAPTCTLTTTKTSIQLSGLGIPLWLFITIVVLLAILLLAIAVFLMCYFCCRYCCASGSRRGERRDPFRQTDSRFQDTRHSKQSFTRDQATGTPAWMHQRSDIKRNDKESHKSVETTTGPRVIRVLPGEQFVILPEEDTDSAYVRENGIPGKGNKVRIGHWGWAS